MAPKLTNEQELAVQQSHGCLQVQGDGNSYIVMSMQLFREMMGVGSDDEYQASLQAVQEGIVDIEAGRTRPVGQFFDEFDRKHGIQS